MDVVVQLSEQGIPANLGNPGQVMPHLVRPLVAVHLKEESLEKRIMEASVCSPQAQNYELPLKIATQVAYTLTGMGAQCTWGEYSFDSKCAMHIIKVYATWNRTTT